jgi:NhaP-type Na+/H+ or K+/H+ antiporter
LAFGVMLLISVSLSGLAARTVLSTALLFLVAGAVLGPGGLGLVQKSAEDNIVAVLADIALFTVLFTDGQRASVPALREGWRLSGRALGLGFAAEVDAAIMLVPRLVRAAGLSVRDVTTEDPSLEDVFVALTYGAADRAG